jgi:TIR domain/Trypsin-like peptidase domain
MLSEMIGPRRSVRCFRAPIDRTRFVTRVSAPEWDSWVAQGHVMSSTEDVAAQTGAGFKLKVFVSYSRKDAVFADELVSGLELCGFEAYLDKDDIAPGEPWEARLGRLIRDADTVVFVLSPSSVASDHCEWEVTETVRLSKRLLPIIRQVVPDNEVPQQLRRLNYIYFNEGRSITKSLGELANALRIDLDWIRQHTRFAELAANWEGKGRSPSLLLLGGEIDDAKAWLVKKPKNAPQITIQQQAFIDASIQAAEEAQKRDLALQWRAKSAMYAAIVILVMGISVAIILLLQTISANKELKAANLATENAKNDLALELEKLRAANLRLGRKISLRVAPSSNTRYFVGPNWYQIASDYSGAIAIVTVNPRGGGQYLASGFIMRGSALYAPWGDEAVFVTASHVITSKQQDRLPELAQASFPGLEEKNVPLRFGEILWEGAFESRHPEKGHDLAVLRIKGTLPFGAKPIEKVRGQEFENLPDLDPRSLASTSVVTHKTFTRPLAMIGVGAMGDTTNEEKTGFALFLNNLLGVFNRDSDGKPLNLAYTDAAQGGTSGSPVFDVETGELVAIHHLGLSNGAVGAGVSIVSVIAAIAKDLAKQK